MEKIIQSIFQSMTEKIKLDNLELLNKIKTEDFESFDFEKLIEPLLNDIKTSDLQLVNQMFEKNKDLISKVFGSDKIIKVFSPYLDLLFQNLKEILESNKTTKEKLQTLKEIIKEKFINDMEENPNLKDEFSGLKDTFFNSIKNLIEDPMALVDMFMTKNKPINQSNTDKKLLRIERLRNKLKTKNRLKN